MHGRVAIKLARQVVGKVGLWHKETREAAEEIDWTSHELILQQRKPVQRNCDLRCDNELRRRLQLYRQIAGKAVLKQTASCTTRSSELSIASYDNRW
jgi:hypothetical protein